MKKFIFFLFAFFCGFSIFFSIIKFQIPTDIQVHSRILVEFYSVGTFPIPPLYYLCIFLVSGFCADAYYLTWAAVPVLSLAVAYKFKYSYDVFGYLFSSEPNPKLQIEGLILVFALLFSAPVFYDVWTNNMYLGRLATTVWHNSTTILAMPFIILLFYESLKWLRSTQIFTKQILVLIFLGIINILIKPSFLFAFVPVFPFTMLLVERRLSKRFWMAVLISGILFLGILAEYYVIYQLELFNIVYKGDKGGIIIAPFLFWKIYSKNILLDSLVSLSLPIAYCLFYPKDLLRNIALQYSILLFLSGLFIGVALAESGGRISHGNLFWQVIMTNYILFLVIISSLYGKIKLSGYNDWRNGVLLLIFAAHVGSGFLYLFKIFYMGSYI